MVNMNENKYFVGSHVQALCAFTEEAYAVCILICTYEYAHCRECHLLFIQVIYADV